MTTTDFTTAILVKQTPEIAFSAINNIGDWWAENWEGRSEKLNDVFTVHFGETFITVKIVEFIPNQKISWHVVDCYKHWLKDKKEWKGTTMHWEVAAKSNATQISFTHVGLVPGIECYNGCEKAWNFYIAESLFKLLTAGKGNPELK